MKKSPAFYNFETQTIEKTKTKTNEEILLTEFQIKALNENENVIVDQKMYTKNKQVVLRDQSQGLFVPELLILDEKAPQLKMMSQKGDWYAVKVEKITP